MAEVKVYGTEGRVTSGNYKAKVTRLEVSDDGLVTQTVIAEPKKKKRVSKKWRKFDKSLRRMAKAQQTTADEYLKRHERSNSKKKNGAVRDLSKNLSKASRKGRKKLKFRIL